MSIEFLVNLPLPFLSTSFIGNAILLVLDLTASFLDDSMEKMAGLGQ